MRTHIHKSKRWYWWYVFQKGRSYRRVRTTHTSGHQILLSIYTRPSRRIVQIRIIQNRGGGRGCGTECPSKLLSLRESEACMMKSIGILLVPVLFTTVLLGGCVVQYNPPVRKVMPVPQYQPQSAEDLKNKVPAQPLLLSQIGCKDPARWEWANGKMVCGTPNSVTGYPYWNQPYYGYSPYGYGYPYMYGGYGRYW